VLKYGGYCLLRRLHHFIVTSGKLPQQWKDASIVTIYKRKDDKSVCGNSRGISLLSVAGRRGGSTTDMIYVAVARLLQEQEGLADANGGARQR